MVSITSNIAEKRKPRENQVVIESEGGLTGKFTAFAQDIYNWSVEAGVEVDFIATWYDDGSKKKSIWEIDNPEHRTMFLLQWEIAKTFEITYAKTLYLTDE